MMARSKITYRNLEPSATLVVTVGVGKELDYLNDKFELLCDFLLLSCKCAQDRRTD